MITNEAEIRIALQATIASVLALYGFWGCALLVFLILLPWKPLLAVGGYLVQPVVDWRMQKARNRHEKGIAQIEEELDTFLRSPRGTPPASAPVPAAKPAPPTKAFPSQSSTRRPLESFKSTRSGRPILQNTETTPQNLAATLAIPPVIKDHVRNLPQGVFSNMDLAVEEVKFYGDKAEAYVRFQSPNVTELVIRQRYVLRRFGDQWKVESRQPANGAGRVPAQTPSMTRPSMHMI
jgi:hypothetical protein